MLSSFLVAAQKADNHPESVASMGCGGAPGPPPRRLPVEAQRVQSFDEILAEHLALLDSLKPHRMRRECAEWDDELGCQCYGRVPPPWDTECIFGLAGVGNPKPDCVSISGDGSMVPDSSSAVEGEPFPLPCQYRMKRYSFKCSKLALITAPHHCSVEDARSLHEELWYLLQAGAVDLDKGLDLADKLWQALAMQDLPTVFATVEQIKVVLDNVKGS